MIIILSPINSEQIWLIGYYIGCCFLDAILVKMGYGYHMDHIWACNQELKLHQDLKSSMLGVPTSLTHTIRTSTDAFQKGDPNLVSSNGFV